MSTRIRAVVATVAVVLVATTSGAAPAAGQSPPPRPAGTPLADHVVLVGFDGFDPAYLGRAPTPTIDALTRRGAIGQTQGVMLSVTNPSFASLATGAWPDRTGNVAYWFDPATGGYRGQSRDIAVPTIAEAVRAQGGTTASAQYFILQNHGTAYADPEAVYTQPGGPCSRRFDDAIAMIEQRPVNSGGRTLTVPRIPTLLGVYCDNFDAVGHDEGAESPLIASTLVELDAQLGRLVAALDGAGIAGRTTIVLTGDHGMTTHTRTFGTGLLDQLAIRGLEGEYLSGSDVVDPDTDVALTSAGGAANAYLLGDLKGDRRAERLVREAAAATEGTGTILDRRTQRRLRMDPRNGDLVIEARPGWAASDGAVAAPPDGRHGSSGERQATFLISGAGVRRQRPSHQAFVRHIDVAPTIARLLGIDPPSGSEGRVPGNLLRPR